MSVSYAEKAGQMQDGKPFTSRIVRSFDKDLGNGRKNYVQHNSAPKQESPRSGANTASSGLSQAEFSRRLGIQGHLNALLSNPSYFPEIGYAQAISVAIEIEDKLEQQLNPSPVRKAVEKANPEFFKAKKDYGEAMEQGHNPVYPSSDDPTNGEWNPMVNDMPDMSDVSF